MAELTALFEKGEARLYPSTFADLGFSRRIKFYGHKP